MKRILFSLSTNIILQFLLGVYIGLRIGQNKEIIIEKPFLGTTHPRVIIGIYSNADNMRTRGSAIYDTWFKREWINIIATNNLYFDSTSGHDESLLTDFVLDRF